MANTDTNAVEDSAEQAIRIAEAGGELVRFTTQGVREALSLGEIRELIRKKGYSFPVSADVHFNPKAAFEAASTADKVRINPGNFVDAARTFRKLEFTDEEYASDAVFRVSSFCNSKMQGVGHPVLRHPLHEQSYGFHHHGGVGSFDGNNDISEIHLTAYVKKLHDRFHHTCRSVAITAHYTV